ncbi:hypothetical protein TWF718_003527 [Orbilia javanica]|uniref:SpvB-domain-containing protein n=1 Tax=Orbilia javanica TaxID=47235 RepID=A0AAN8NKV0_9PEZI
MLPSLAQRSAPQGVAPASTQAAAAAPYKGLDPSNSGSSNLRKPGSPASLPSLSLPKGGGAIKDIGEKFSVNAVSGTADLTVPIPLTPARGAAGAPSLVLRYSSGSGNGPFGLGWSLSNGSVSRKTDKGLPRYVDGVGTNEDGDVFVAAGEDLVPQFQDEGGSNNARDSSENKNLVWETVIDGWRVRRYRQRIEGKFDRIERWTNLENPGDVHWRSISRDNVTSIFGPDENSRVYSSSPSSSSDSRPRIFTWLLAEMYAIDGNAVLFTYKAEDGIGIRKDVACEQNRSKESISSARYLKSIKYGNLTPNRDSSSWRAFSAPTLSSQDWMFSVVFDYGEHDGNTPTSQEVKPWPARQDSFSQFRSGFEIRTYRICHRILMFHHFPTELGRDDYLVRSTNFVYDENAVATMLRQVQEFGYIWDDGSNAYIKKPSPPLEFTYSIFPSQEELRQRPVLDINAASLENLPMGVDGSNYMWVDLDGEGSPGVFTEQGDGWFYKRNLSGNNLRQEPGQNAIPVAKFGTTEVLSTKPAMDIASGDCMFVDLLGSGKMDILFRDPLSSTWGFFQRDADSTSVGWSTYHQLNTFPSVDWESENVKFIDVTGDGLSDLVVAEEDVFTFYPLLGERGYDAAEWASKGLSGDAGPRLIFADIESTIHLADMTGDGLHDILRVRNCDVSYWPNLGYGKFGPRIVMDNAPTFTSHDQFNQHNLLVADIDSTGTADLLYFRNGGVDIYINQSGNGYSDRIELNFSGFDNFTSVTVTDLLGSGTPCIVWSSYLNGRISMRYMDLCQAIKPRLLSTVTNNVGSETRVHYASSTKFYLDDRQAGRPWVTRLAFPVHCVERVESFDWVSYNRFETRYAYHHGYFDGYEREFRGFAMVEQWDTQDFSTMNSDSSFPAGGANIEAAWHLPPSLTKTWFHTGVYVEGENISRHLAREYFGAPAASADNPTNQFEDFWATLLPDTILPSALTASEAREACRALKGQILRKEVYSLDGTSLSSLPYTISETNYTINPVSPLQDSHGHSVFSINPRETITYNLERNLSDPRIHHELALQHDIYGNSLKSLTIDYGRSKGKSPLDPGAREAQESTLIQYTQYELTNSVEEPYDYVLPQMWESKAYQLHGFERETPQSITFDRFTSSDFSLLTQLPEIRYDEEPNPQVQQKRLIDRAKSLYRSNDLSKLLGPGVLESRAIVGESYQLIFTAELLAKTFKRGMDDGSMEDLIPDPLDLLGGKGESDGCYIDLEGDGNWWLPSGRSFFHPNASSTPQEEEIEAKAHFFRHRRHVEPSGQEVIIDYDPYDLSPTKSIDALENKIELRVDYRVSHPDLMTDCNGNRSQCAYDELGHVIGLAQYGKTTENVGDSLNGFQIVVGKEDIDQLFEAPTSVVAARLLGNATTRYIYDQDRFWVSQQKSASAGSVGRTRSPTWNAILTREQHSSDPTVGSVKIHVTFAYFDGCGQEIQHKLQAEPDEQTALPRWVGSGWTVYNNKGNQVRKFEPFFDDTHKFRPDEKVGVASTILYDPLGRAVGTLHPNHTWEKVVFSPWHEEHWDVGDTVLADPKTDPDIGGLFQLLQDDMYLPTWYSARVSGKLGTEERTAATKSAVYAATPTTIHKDPMGRPIVNIVDNGEYGKYVTYSILDVQGKKIATIDPQSRIAEQKTYDMKGNCIHLSSMEAGERWILTDAMGMEIRRWDGRHQMFRTSRDELHRPTAIYLSLSGDSQNEICVEKTVYGETLGSIAIDNNQRGQVVQILDQAGVVKNNQYDFKGNLLSIDRQLAREYKSTIDWLHNVPLEDKVYQTRTVFDALNRQVQVNCPDQSIISYEYNLATMLEKVKIKIRGEQQDSTIVQNINYDAKGQRVLIERGNGATTTYEYDKNTFNLTKVRTKRRGPGGDTMQDLFYFYDATNNIVRVRDDYQQTIYFRNQRVDPNTDYTYDPVYRLIVASGREHLGQSAGRKNALSAPGPWNSLQTRLDHPGDGNAVGRYLETYSYDSVGNILSLQHQGSDPGSPGWTQTYAYSSPSQIEPGKINNRLSSTSIGSQTETYSYYGLEGVHGNMTKMPHLSMMSWNYRDQLHATSRQIINTGDIPETTWYVYNASGQRVRKVTDRQTPKGQEPAKLKEVIYLGLNEMYRRYTTNGDVTHAKDTISIMDDKKRVAMIEARVDSGNGGGGGSSLPPRLIRYQFSNHLDSCTLEMDQDAQVISYEEYTPFGNTSYQAVRNQTDAPKRYRFMAKERDKETGLYYYGYRYYAPWIGRWINADPIGIDDGVNLFCFVADNPINHTDPHGTATGPSGVDPAIVQLNQQAANYANQATWEAVKTLYGLLNPEDHGAQGKLYHEHVDHFINVMRGLGRPGSAASRTVDNVAIRPIPGENRGVIVDVGGAIHPDCDNLDTVTWKAGGKVPQKGDVIDFGHFEHVGEHKSNKGAIKADQARWGQTFATYKPNKLPNFTSILKNIFGGRGGKNGGGGSGASGGTGGGRPPVGASWGSRMTRWFGSSGGGGGGLGGLQGMASGASQGLGRLAFPFVPEITDFANDWSGFARETGRFYASFLENTGVIGRVILTAGVPAGIGGIVAENLAANAGMRNPEVAGQLSSLALGGTIGYFATKGVGIGFFGGPWGWAAGAVVGGLVGLGAYYFFR